MVIDLTSVDQGRLAEMAAVMQISEAEVAREAMHWFLAPRESESEIIARSRLEIAEGKTIGHEELFAQIETLLDE